MLNEMSVNLQQLHESLYFLFIPAVEHLSICEHLWMLCGERVVDVPQIRKYFKLSIVNTPVSKLLLLLGKVECCLLEEDSKWMQHAEDATVNNSVGQSGREKSVIIYLYIVSGEDAPRHMVLKHDFWVVRSCIVKISPQDFCSCSENILECLGFSIWRGHMKGRFSWKMLFLPLPGLTYH